MSPARRPVLHGTARSLLALIIAAPLLSGCVVAAIPVLAAGGLVKARTDARSDRDPAAPRVALPGETGESTSATQPPVVTAVPAPAGATVRDYVLADGSQVTVTNALAQRSAGPASRPGSLVVERRTDLTELPAATGATSAANAASSGGLAAFADYAKAQAAIPAAGAERRSALLADPTRMEAKTRSCSIHPAAVLIDLDPVGDAIDPARPLAATPGLAGRLAGLRADEVTIGWVSGRTADRAGAIRRALQTSGLDPAGRDELVLLRFPEERKQTRRNEFAKGYCVVALAGDERADFDELFAYLRDPDLALPLEPLLGKGWFLIPTPLTTN